jgi:hypothetical protein
MNAFCEHHKDSIGFGYRGFERIVLNGLIQPFQQPEWVIGFFNGYRQVYPVSRDVLRGAADNSRAGSSSRADKWNAPIVEAGGGARQHRDAQPEAVGERSDRGLRDAPLDILDCDCASEARCRDREIARHRRQEKAKALPQPHAQAEKQRCSDQYQSGRIVGWPGYTLHIRSGPM